MKRVVTADQQILVKLLGVKFGDNRTRFSGAVDCGQRLNTSTFVELLSAKELKIFYVCVVCVNVMEKKVIRGNRLAGSCHVQ
jgi:hypothetical protein